MGKVLSIKVAHLISRLYYLDLEVLYRPHLFLPLVSHAGECKHIMAGAFNSADREGDFYTNRVLLSPLSRWSTLLPRKHHFFCRQYLMRGGVFTYHGL